MSRNVKKKRIVKLEPQTVELFAEVLSKLRPPPPLTVSQWADKYRVLSAESSAEPGRWHTEKAPYQRAIMDAIGDPHVRSVVVMSAAQIGKTDAFILNPLGYYMDYAPCPVMCMQPTLDMGQTLSKDRIAPMIRDTPRLTGLVDTKSRYAGNTVMKKNFPGGHITIVGANSPSSLASRPIKVLLADEIDRYPKSAGTEGDPLDLAKKRQTTFWDYKTVMVSTPTIKGDSRIEDAYLLSTQEEWNVPCPECGAYQPFLWENVKFDTDDLDKGVSYLMNEARRPMTDRVICKAPEEVEYSIDFTYYIGSGNSKGASIVQESVAKAVEEFQEWQRSIGRDINPMELIARLRAAGVKRVELRQPVDKVIENGMDSGKAVVQIPKLSGTPTIIYGGIEDD